MNSTDTEKATTKTEKIKSAGPGKTELKAMILIFILIGIVVIFREPIMELCSTIFEKLSFT